MKENYVLTIKAEARPGLLHLITGVIEKRQVKITSLSLAPTDIHDIVLITIEVCGDESNLVQLALKLENIIEVFAVEMKQYNSMVCLRAAYFKLSKSFLETPKTTVLSQHNAAIVMFYPDALLVAKYGTDASILSLYNELDGPHLMGFSQTGLITDSSLIDDEVRVISQRNSNHDFTNREGSITRLAA